MALASGELPLHLYKAVVEQTRDYAVFVLDPDGRIRSWNLGACLLKGYRADEIVGRHFSVFYTADAVKSGWPDHELKVATAEGRFEDEGWRVRKDGSRFWANVVITALRDEEGKLVGFSKFTRDLTERKMHEEAIRQSEERFRLLVEGVQDYAIYMLDVEGHVSSWNYGAERIKGYAREEILGRHFSRFYTEEDIKAGAPWEEIATAKRTGKVEREGWRLRKNGERFWARTVMTPLYDSQGNLRGYAKVTQDLTDRRHIQELETAARQVNEFIAVLAHELRNPLAPIRSAIQLMRTLPADNPAQQGLRDTIDRQSAQLTRIVEDMVDISRVTRGALAIDSAPIDIGQVVRRAVESSAPAIQTGRHALDVDLPKEPIVVKGDVLRLVQVLTNVLNNAARYTPEGGRIVVSARPEDGSAVVRVRDTGIGIPADMMGSIFNMFVQGRSPLQRVSGGLGIGLALARKIAELHGGTLEASSAGANEGSEFVLRLPLVQTQLVPEAAEEAAARDPIAKRVLIVDDNADAAMTLDMLLRAMGHETRIEHDGMSALRAAPEFRPDVVLLDIGMPGMDGYEVARRLSVLKKQKHFRIIAVSGWGQEADRQRSSEAGFDLHLVKPVDANVLSRVVAHRNGEAVH
jgi:PAS domain S-box-containing protein